MTHIVSTSIPRVTVNGKGSYWTMGTVIDHLNRTLSGAVVDMEEARELVTLLRSLRKDDVVDLRFQHTTPYDNNDTVKVTIEYEGKAQATMIRVRPRRQDILCVKFKFKLLE